MLRATILFYYAMMLRAFTRGADNAAAFYALIATPLFAAMMLMPPPLFADDYCFSLFF